MCLIMIVCLSLSLFVSVSFSVYFASCSSLSFSFSVNVVSFTVSEQCLHCGSFGLLLVLQVWVRDRQDLC